MNYANYTYNKTKLDFLKLFEIFQHFPKCRMYVGIVGMFCIMNHYFEYRIRIVCITLYVNIG